MTYSCEIGNVYTLSYTLIELKLNVLCSVKYTSWQKSYFIPHILKMVVVACDNTRKLDHDFHFL